jgi:hypothetical protein
LAEIYTVSLHSSYTAENVRFMLNENNAIQKFYHSLRMTLFCMEFSEQQILSK